jgi:hypothetical protein
MAMASGLMGATLGRALKQGSAFAIDLDSETQLKRCEPLFPFGSVHLEPSFGNGLHCGRCDAHGNLSRGCGWSSDFRRN